MAERKLVTVLCGTLANTVTLVERLGLEALPRLHQALLDLVQQEVLPYHGTLQAVGIDSFLRRLASRWPWEDHPRLAVTCSAPPCNAVCINSAKTPVCGMR